MDFCRELAGRDIYIAEGCYNCHSQMIRPMRHETERYGEYSKGGEFIYDRPFQWRSRRIGPDLHLFYEREHLPGDSGHFVRSRRHEGFGQDQPKVITIAVNPYFAKRPISDVIAKMLDQDFREAGIAMPEPTQRVIVEQAAPQPSPAAAPSPVAPVTGQAEARAERVARWKKASGPAARRAGQSVPRRESSTLA